jgi:hypothetical protein
MTKQDLAVILSLACAAMIAFIYGLLAVQELLRW